MDARTLFSKLKTETVDVDCLKEGDIIHLDYCIAIVQSVTHHEESQWRECIELEWESDGDSSSIIYPANTPGYNRKWARQTIIAREFLRE
jgi:hypothetical protein